MGSLKVSTRKCLDFLDLESAVLIVEALRSGTSSGGQIFVVFELPVSPSNGTGLVDEVSHLRDLSCTFIRVETSSELRNNEWDLECLSVMSSGKNSVLVPFLTLLGLVLRWFSRSANIRCELATVGVVIEHVILRSNLAAWGLLKSRVEDLAK